jgi:hypothetical protein
MGWMLMLAVVQAVGLIAFLMFKLNWSEVPETMNKVLKA